MKDFGLIVQNLRRKAFRTSLMVVAIFIAFFIFGMLGSFNKVFNAGVDLSAANRLVTVNKINFTVAMPYAYINRVRAIEGVEVASWANWFGGYYQDPTNFVQAFAVDPESWLQAYPELIVAPEDRSAFLSDRASVLIGEAVATQYGWEKGDLIPLSSNIFSQAGGDNTWQLNVAGTFQGADTQAQTNYVIFHWENFNETVTFGNDQIGWMVVATSSPDINDQVINAIDSQFANSSAETETTTEEAFSKAFIAQIGNIGLIVSSVVGAAFATILMIVGTTMVMAVRERTKEIAVMKTLGFTSPRISRLVIGESLLLTLIGGLLGIGASWLAITVLASAVAGILPGFALMPDTVLIAVGLMVLLGLITGAAPAYNALNIKIAEALSKD